MALNALMLASTPVIGGHYLIDIAAGAAIAIASILAVMRLSCVLLGASPASTSDSRASVDRQTASARP